VERKTSKQVEALTIDCDCAVQGGSGSSQNLPPICFLAVSEITVMPPLLHGEVRIGLGNNIEFERKNGKDGTE
jgi:hypothetical protein